jgi:hypothetical protein
MKIRREEMLPVLTEEQADRLNRMHEIQTECLAVKVVTPEELAEAEAFLNDFINDLGL